MNASFSFLLDENIPYSAISLLEKRGHTVAHVRKVGKAGIRNGEVYQLAADLNSWIITRDADFKSYIKFISYDVKGVIVFISDTQFTRSQFAEVLEKFLDRYESRFGNKLLIVIDNDEITVLTDE